MATLTETEKADLKKARATLNRLTNKAAGIVPKKRKKAPAPTANPKAPAKKKAA